MKPIVFLLSFVCFSFITHAQNKYETTQTRERLDASTWLSFGGGTNYHNGIMGFQFEQRFTDHVSGFGALGVGSWGYKSGVGFKYYVNYPKGNAYSVSFTRAAGALLTRTKLEVEDLLTGVTESRAVDLELYPLHQINVSWIRYWQMGRRMRFHIEAGISFSLNDDFDSNYRITSSGFATTKRSRMIMRALQPGGILFGLGFDYGFGNK